MSSGSARRLRRPRLQRRDVVSTTAFGAVQTHTVALGVVEHRDALGQREIADVEAVADRERRDVDVDVIRDVRRIDAEVHLVHRLLEDAARVANALRDAGEAKRDADRDLLARDELLEVDVQDVALERVALDLADQRLRDRCPRR